MAGSIKALFDANTESICEKSNAETASHFRPTPAGFCPVAQSIPPAVLGLLARAAAAKGMLGGQRVAIQERLREFARDLPGGLGLPGAGDLPTDKDLLAAATAAGTAAASAPTVRDIGAAFERSRFPDAALRKQAGSFYTPENVIDRILDLVWPDVFPSSAAALSPAGKVAPPVPILDPAMGCAFFLVRAAERLLGTNPPEEVRRFAGANFHGVDVDPAAVFMARALLWLTLSDSVAEFVPDPARLLCADSLLGPGFGQTARRSAEPPAKVAALDWAAAFPEVASAGGFAAIVGNPPYEVLTNFRKFPARQALALALRASGFYSSSTGSGGQTNLYRAFCERSLGLLRQGGALSFVVPLSLARDAAALPLRRRLLEQEGAAEWLLFGEDARLFPGVTQSACIFRARRGGGRAERVMVHAVAGSAAGAKSESGRVELSLAEMEANSGGGLTIPFLAGREAALWRWVWGHCAGRITDAAEMRVGEVDQTVFRDCMTDTPTDCVLARGRHLAPFRLDVRPVPGRERFLLLDRFLEKKGSGAQATVQRAAQWRVAQLGIRNMASRPRLVAALAPPGVYLGNSLNYFVPKAGTSLEFLAGALNSRLLDWLFRTASGNNNINLHEMRRLPFPSGAAAEQIAAVEAAYAACVAAAEGEAGTELAAAREQLDAAVEATYRLPAGLAAALER